MLWKPPSRCDEIRSRRCSPARLSGFARVGLRQVFDNPSDLTARADVLLGAALAGMAIENSMLGAAHAAANPLTARYGVLHGHAVGLMLPAVVRFNAKDASVAPLYHQLAVQGGLTEAGPVNGIPAGDKIAGFLRGYQQRTGLPQSLNGIELTAHDIDALAADAAKQWTGTFNPGLSDPRNLQGCIGKFCSKVKVSGN